MRQLKAEYYKMKYSRDSEVGFSIYGIYFFYTVRCGK